MQYSTTRCNSRRLNIHQSFGNVKEPQIMKTRFQTTFVKSFFFIKCQHRIYRIVINIIKDNGILSKHKVYCDWNKGGKERKVSHYTLVEYWYMNVTIATQMIVIVMLDIFWKYLSVKPTIFVSILNLQTANYSHSLVPISLSTVVSPQHYTADFKVKLSWTQFYEDWRVWVWGEYRALPPDYHLPPDCD